MRREVRHSFPAPGAPRTRRVGVEQELFVGHRSDHRPVPVPTVRRLAARALTPGVLGFEPGGQVELSLPPGTPAAVASDLTRQVGRLGEVLALAGLEIAGGAIDPWRVPADVPLQLDSPRYVGMQAHFDRIGPAGRVMMRATASTQVCADWWSGREGLEQWRVAHLIGPPLAAFFADGRPGVRGRRLRTWLAVDPPRCAWDDRLVVAADPQAAYSELAESAQTFAMPGDDDPDNGSLTWREWLRSRGDVPGAAAHHLSTLLPPVRPRGRYLELRYLDGQPLTDVAVLLAVVSVALYDGVTRGRLLRMLTQTGPELAERWHRASSPQPDPALLDEASLVLSMAGAGLREGSARLAGRPVLAQIYDLVGSTRARAG